MPTAAQVMASIANAQASTGPRSEAGLAASSKNALKTGLYAATDFIRPGEEADYAAIAERLEQELSPGTLLEENLADEILRAMWKLRRCGQVEGTFAARLATGSEPIPDPMQNEAAAKLQNSVDRARAQSHRLLHRCIAELRRLQTERLYVHESLPEGTSVAYLGIADFRAILKGLDETTAAELRSHKLADADSVVASVANEHRELAAIPALMRSYQQARATDVPATKRTPAANQTSADAPQTGQIARNAACPCKSGEKYKRCCGKNAPAVLRAA